MDRERIKDVFFIEATDHGIAIFSGDFKKIEQQLMHYQPENRLTALVELEIVEDQFDPSIINLQNELTEAAPFGNYKIIKTRLSFKNKLENIELLANHEHIMNFSPKEVFQKRLDAEIIDATFVDEYNSGVYSKIISPNEIQEAYECRTYGLINGYKVSIRKELKDTFFVGTGDRKIADILGLNRTDKYLYEKEIAKDKIEVVQEKKKIEV